MSLVIFLLSLLTALGMWEMWRHTRHRRRVPIRVHVNGSRGKSSVARLIAAGLRAGGLQVVAKTTGSAASIIHTDGRETPVRRRGGPNIKEQLRVMRTAARENCDALVVECMAVRPDLQRVSEQTIVRATHGVITNVRPDHLEVMGPTLDDVAASLAGTVPRRGHLFAADDRYDDYLARRASRSGSSYTHCSGEGITTDLMQGFGYVEFAENVGLALAVCESVGVERKQALAGMYQVQPDVGALTRWRVPCPTANNPDRVGTFLNGFATNDPDSYLRVWRRLELEQSTEPVFILMNIRADRQRRSKDLAPLLGRQMCAQHYLLIGQDTALFADLLRRNRVPRQEIIDLHGLPPADLWDRIAQLTEENFTVFGMGNIAGIGHGLLDLLRERRLPA